MSQTSLAMTALLLLSGIQSCSSDGQQEALEEIEQQQQEEQQDEMVESSSSFSEPDLPEEPFTETTDNTDSLASELDKLATSTDETAPIEENTNNTAIEQDNSLATSESSLETPERPVVNKLGESAQSYIVQPGDTLAGISYKLYGNSSRWPELADNNGISMPSMIFPGDVIRYEANTHSESFSETLNKASEEVIMVQEGDTLEIIAERLFGRRDYWKPMWQLNRDTIPNPNLIYSGQIIKYFDPKKLEENMSAQ